MEASEEAPEDGDAEDDEDDEAVDGEASEQPYAPTHIAIASTHRHRRGRTMEAAERTMPTLCQN